MEPFNDVWWKTLTLNESCDWINTVRVHQRTRVTYLSAPPAASILILKSITCQQQRCVGLWEAKINKYVVKNFSLKDQFTQCHSASSLRLFLSRFEDFCLHLSETVTMWKHWHPLYSTAGSHPCGVISPKTSKQKVKQAINYPHVRI